MRANSRTTLGTRRAWTSPTVTTWTIGAETQSAREAAAPPAPPQQPAAPSSKLGFSFEMAFPLSARTGQ